MNNILQMQKQVETVERAFEPALLEPGETVCETLNGNGHGDMVLACEHASHHIPNYFNGLGLSKKARHSHAAWDPGAKDLALDLSDAFDAPLVCSKISRLVYDCNRPENTPSAMPSRSEIFDIPGNIDIPINEAQARLAQIYHPFERMLSSVLQSRGQPVLVTVHSFTPVFNGKKREVEIGILHGTDSRLADAMLEFVPADAGFVVRRNEPYGPTDGVAHTIETHGQNRGLLNVMIEVRNDLLGDPKNVMRAANVLAKMLTGAMKKLNSSTKDARS